MIGRQMDPVPFADAVIDEFEELLLAAEDRPIVMSVVLHSFISGVPFRLRQVRRALAHIAARADRVWLTQPAAIHRAFTELMPPPAEAMVATPPTEPDPSPTS